jgi:hypothetical protein
LNLPQVKPVLLLLLLLLSTRGAWAAPSGLNIIPTTDLLDVRQIEIGIQNTNVNYIFEPTVFDKPLPQLQTQMGLTPRLEAGIDVGPVDVAQYGPLLNVKWLVATPGLQHPALAVGVFNLAQGLNPAYYAVASHPLTPRGGRQVRLHSGALWDGYAMQAMLGLDAELGNSVTLYTDWTSGQDGFASFGFDVEIDEVQGFDTSILYSNGFDRLGGVMFTYKWDFDI